MTTPDPSMPLASSQKSAPANHLLSPMPSRWRQLLGLFSGPLLFLILLLVGAPDALITQSGSEAAANAAWGVLAVLVLMIVWWVTEAVPIPVTALLPLVAFPLLGIQSIKETSAEYMHPIVVLLMGGFIVAKAIERWNLHTRIALNIVTRVGSRPSMIIGGFMFAAALMSMWISNSATSIMLTPIALSVAAAIYGKDHRSEAFTFALLIGIAHACSIGGLGTPVGTPTNLIVIGFLEETSGTPISFAQWMMIGVPTVLLMVPIAWFVLTRIAFKLKDHDAELGQDTLLARKHALGNMTRPEVRTLMVFAVVAGLWIFKQPLQGIRVGDVLIFEFVKEPIAQLFGDTALSAKPFGGLTDHITAIIGVILCFLVPAGSTSEPTQKVLDWKTAESIPWGPLLLFGGGLSLAMAIRTSGLGDWFGQELSGLASLPVFVVVLLVTCFVVFLTEVMSNVATAASLMPILGATALAAGIDLELMGVPIALAASCAFMLPTATGPNAVIFASDTVSLPTMARAGFLVNVAAIIVITAITLIMVPRIF